MQLGKKVLFVKHSWVTRQKVFIVFFLCMVVLVIQSTQMLHSDWLIISTAFYIAHNFSMEEFCTSVLQKIQENTSVKRIKLQFWQSD